MNDRFWWRVPLAYCALGAAVGYAAGVLMGKLPAAINIPVTLILSVFLWTWAFRTMRELQERKAVIDEMLVRCEEMREEERRSRDRRSWAG